MALIALRSPQFKHKLIAPVNTVMPKSSVCKIYIDTDVASDPKYTLIKNVEPDTTVFFDISELARDYINIQYQSDYVPQTIDIITTIENFPDLNGGGAKDGDTTTYTDIGFEAYGSFEEGVNPELPTDAFLISKNSTTDSVELYYPVGKAGKVPQVISSLDPTESAVTFNSAATTIGGIYTSLINRIDCTKYGIGNRIIFINKFGSQQDLWFFLKKTKSLSRTNEGYKSNTIAFTDLARYSVTDAPNKVFNTIGRQTHTLSSGYYSESANNFFEELLLSEYVWMERENKTTSAVEIIPVNVKSSSVDFKSSVNDRLIEYTMEFEEAFDYINNIR